MGMLRHSGWWLSAAVAVAICCAPAPAAAPVELTAERVDVVVGRTLVTPVTLLDRRAAQRGVTFRLDDGRSIEARVWWIGTLPPEEGRGRAEWFWTRPAEPMVARSIGDAPREGDAAGGWHLLLDLPIDAFGQGLWLENRRYGVRWLSDPYRVGVSAGADGRPPAGLWAGPLPPGAAEDPLVAGALAREESAPQTRWRALLAREGLDPTVPLGREAGGGAVRTGAELAAERRWPEPLEAFARQREALWQAALARVWLRDRAVGEALRTRLAGVAKIETPAGRRYAPTWDLDPLTQTDLLPDLLSPLVDDDAAVLRARAWLATRPAAAAWVVDAGGLAEALRGDPILTLGLLSMGPGGAVRVVGGVAAPVLEVAEPDAVRSLRATLRTDPPGPVGVRVGATELVLSPQVGLVAARPPGVRLGPSQRDWTLDAVQASAPGQGARPNPSEAAVLSVARRADAPLADLLDGWRLTVECVAAEGDAAADTVRVWLGPFGRPDAVVRVSRDGAAVLLDQSAPAAADLAPAVRADGSGWTVALDLPRALVPADGVLRVGVERATPEGVRTALPQRMMPWQDEPGRAAIDLRAWGGLPGRD